LGRRDELEAAGLGGLELRVELGLAELRRGDDAARRGARGGLGLDLREGLEAPGLGGRELRVDVALRPRARDLALGARELLGAELLLLELDVAAHGRGLEALVERGHGHGLRRRRELHREARRGRVELPVVVDRHEDALLGRGGCHTIKPTAFRSGLLRASCCATCSSKVCNSFRA